MPDITMCRYEECKKKTACYRYTAGPSKYMQSYFANKPRHEKGECVHYWPINNGKDGE